MQKFKEIASRFDIPCEIVRIENMGEGFINDTLRVLTPDGNRDYICNVKTSVCFAIFPQ